jgi:hypothetical protein
MPHRLSSVDRCSPYVPGPQAHPTYALCVATLPLCVGLARIKHNPDGVASQRVWLASPAVISLESSVISKNAI